MRLAAAFPLAHVPESTITLYRSKLAGCDTDALVAVIERTIENSPTFPTIAALRHDYMNERRRRDTDTAPALPIGRSPMPPEIKEQWATTLGKFEDRAKEMEPQ